MLAGAIREGRQGVYVPMAGQEQGSRRATVRRGEKQERGTEGGSKGTHQQPAGNFSRKERHRKLGRRRRPISAARECI